MKDIARFGPIFIHFAVFSSKKSFHRYATKQKKHEFSGLISHPPNEEYLEASVVLGGGGGGEGAGPPHFDCPSWENVSSRVLIYEIFAERESKRKTNTKRVEVAASSSKDVDSFHLPCFENQSSL